jgi:hypothetical protein
MPRSPSPDATIPAERVSTCESCGDPVVAGARGPLPRRHPDCRPPGQELLYRVRSAAKLAHRSGYQALGRELDALAAALLVSGRQTPPSATPRQPSVPEPARAARTPPPAGEWSRYGE